MKHFGYFWALCAFALLTLGGAPASAQATRTWVSGVGDDANPCSRTAPCKTFAGAISKTAVSGEINVLDPGGFGAVTITKSITISSEGFEAGVLVAGTNGIVISAAPTDRVVLKGLDIDGSGNGLDGIKILSAGTVLVIKCDIKHFSGNGINSNSTTAGGRVFVEDSNILFNAGGVNINGNGVQNVGSILRTTINSNTSFAVQASGAGNVVAIANSVLSNSPTAISLSNGGGAVSIGASNAVSGAGAFTSTQPFQ